MSHCDEKHKALRWKQVLQYILAEWMVGEPAGASYHFPYFTTFWQHSSTRHQARESVVEFPYWESGFLPLMRSWWRVGTRVRASVVAGVDPDPSFSNFHYIFFGQ